MTTGPPTTAPTRVTLVGIASAAALVPLNSTMVAVALPRIAGSFDIATGTASILITVYLVAMLVGQPVAGRLSDRVGSRRTVMAALAGFAACSLLAAAAPTFPFLLVARAAQALCASALVPSVQSLLRAATPPGQRGRVFGLFGSVLGVGAAGGPVVGGALVQAFDWYAVFLANVPVALAAMAACLAAAPGGRPPSPAVTAAPPARLLTNPVFVSSFAVQALSALAQYALLLLTPLILDARGWSAGHIGLVLSTLTIGMIAMGPRGGRVGDRLGRRLPVVGGLVVAAAATAVATAAAAAGPGIPPVVLVAVLGAFGLGLGFSTPGATTAGLESVAEDRTGSAGGVLSTARYVGSIVTSIAVSALVTSDASGSEAVLLLATSATVAACLLALRLPGRPAPKEPLAGPLIAGSRPR